MTHRALVIDDEADIRELVAMSLDRIGIDTHTAANLEEARHLLDTYEFDVCLTDMRLPDGNGVDFVKFLSHVKPNMPVAVITAHGNIDTAVVAMKNGAFDFLSKPIDINVLRQLVMQAIETGAAKNSIPAKSDEPLAAANDGPHSTQAPTPIAGSHQDNELLALDTQKTHTTNASLETLSGRDTKATSTSDEVGAQSLIGHSEPMRELRSMIAKVARTNAPVWITGESGTGKELIARLIHENSARNSKPFIAVNCGAIPSELMESEMFGHRKGSFTGAHTDHDGLFKRAEGGTLFLDEVAELPLNMQVKLLRVIQERSVRRVGESEEVAIDVRILSASHKDLSTEVDSGRFRHDLYYRLNVICVKSPNLRSRASDIALIAKHILRNIQTNEPLTTSITLSREAEEALCNYAFPGNVRELENILERAIALVETSTIQVEDLNLSTTHSSNLSNIYDTPLPPVGSVKATHSAERENIENALMQTRWNRKAAAQMLGLSYRQLRYRLQQYGIDNNSTGT